MRRIATLAALAVPALLAAGIGAPGALAADDCPNAAVRAQQQSQHLPNCMAYEKVTPDDKGGAPPMLAAVADGGDGTLFQTFGMIGEPLSYSHPLYQTARGSDGWTTQSLMPPMDGDPVRRPTATDTNFPAAWSRDLSRVLLPTRFPLSPNDQGHGLGANNVLASWDLYLREPDGSFRWLVADPAAVDTTANQDVSFIGASPDLERVVLRTSRQWDPRLTTSLAQLYVSTPEGMRVVSELPDGTLPTANVLADAKGNVSADGRRIVFRVGTGANVRVYVRFNADDQATAVTREVAVGPNGEACTSNPQPRPRLSADGSQVIFQCSNALLPGAPVDANYIRDLDGGPDAVRLLGPGTVLEANADFSRVYMTELQGGTGSLSVVRDGVATLVGPADETASNQNDRFAYTAISPDGEYFAFESATVFDLPAVDQGPTTTRQVFLASAETGALRCVSCHPAGMPTSGAGSMENNRISLFGNSSFVPIPRPVVSPVVAGGTVIFTTTSGLVAEDTDGLADAYAWVDGEPVLLSGGRGESSLAAGASADGSRLFMLTPDALVADDRDGGQFDLYVARVNGGSLVEAPPAPCTVQCQGPAPERPGLPGAGSQAYVGRGNLVEETTTPVKPASVSLSVGSRVRGASTTVRVKVSRAGTIEVSGTGLRRVTKTAKKAGTYRVRVRLSAYGAKQLRTRGRVNTRVSVRLTPASSGRAVPAHRTVTFTRATTKKGGR